MRSASGSEKTLHVRFGGKEGVAEAIGIRSSAILSVVVPTFNERANLAKLD